MKSFFRAVKRGFVVAVLAAFSAPVAVFAALPAGVATAMGTLETDGLALIDLVWAPVAALVVGFIIIKLFKRGAKQV